LPERVATTDLIHDICERASETPFTLFVLGSTDPENAKAIKNLVRKYPALNVVGRSHGYHTSQGWDEVVRQINAIGPDLLLVSLGVPQEQAFYSKYASMLPAVGVIKTAGGLLNFLSGSVRRAPTWLQNIGLEWAFRVVLEPRRLFARYAITNPHALYLILSRTPVHSRSELKFANAK
jgi:exopolysaccharide biosynthesis WecB/TagA/CpsF family protein